jgi:catechol 2,3-dioxygenase-like lactoylglutathione lyase family enzyme
MAPHVSGVLETSLYVADVDASAAFYKRVFGFPVIYTEGSRLRALSVSDKQVLLLFRVGGSLAPTDTPNGRIPPHGGTGSLHVAFSIASDAVTPWLEHLRCMDIQVESEVHCGGHSIYFRDPDSHLLEFITRGCWPIF